MSSLGASCPKRGPAASQGGVRCSEHPLARPEDLSSWRRGEDRGGLFPGAGLGLPSSVQTAWLVRTDEASSPLQLPLHRSTTLRRPGPCWVCPPPYHGNVVAGMEENGEVGLLQAFLQSFQPLHHLISVIPGETWIQRENSANSIPRVLHPRAAESWVSLPSGPSSQEGAKKPKLLPRARSSCPARSHTALESRTQKVLSWRCSGFASLDASAQAI